MLTFDAIGETVFCGTSGDGKAFHMNRLMNFYPQGGMKSVLSLQIENQQIQPLLETINSTDEIYLVDQKGYILAASEPEMAGLPIRTRMPEEDLEQKAQIEFERDGISKIGNIQSGVFGTKILVISDKETVFKRRKSCFKKDDVPDPLQRGYGISLHYLLHKMAFHAGAESGVCSKTDGTGRI